MAIEESARGGVVGQVVGERCGQPLEFERAVDVGADLLGNRLVGVDVVQCGASDAVEEPVEHDEDQRVLRWCEFVEGASGAADRCGELGHCDRRKPL